MRHSPYFPFVVLPSASAWRGLQASAFLLILSLAILATGCKSSQLLAKGLQGKAVQVSANTFVAEVTPANDITHTPTGRVIIASGIYSSTPIGKDGKSYVYHRVVKNPRIFGFIGGSESSVTVIAAKDLAELQAITKALHIANPDSNAEP